MLNEPNHTFACLLPRGLILLLVFIASAGCNVSRFKGNLPALTDAERELSAELHRDLHHLAGQIGERNAIKYEKLAEAANWIEAQLAAAGYTVQRQEYIIDGQAFHNIEAERRGSDRADEIIVVGGHYDTVPGCPGANDNGTGVVGTLALARRFAAANPSRTIRFVAFVNEEPPYFHTSEMGSLVYARRCRQRNEKIVAMLSLETMGYYSDKKGSQHYPFPLSLLYPSTGNFIAIVGDNSSKKLVNTLGDSFQRNASIEYQKGVAPASIQGVGWSDHWSFWQAGYPAVMLTDTAPFRYAHYHTAKDTPDQVDYDRLARVVAAVEKAVGEMAE